MGRMGNRRGKRRLGHAPSLMVLALVLAMIAAACGDDDDTTETTAGTETTAAVDNERGSAADTFDLYNGMSGQARTDALIAAAQEEGTVVFYTASSGMDPVIEAFEDTYDISVQMFVGTSDTVLQRIVQEYEAGFYGIDVFDDAEAFTVARMGMTYEYINPELTDGIPGYDPATHVAATRLSVYTQAWNSDLVDESEIPDTIDGFTDPKWEGRLSMDPRDWVWYIGVREFYMNEKGWTEEQVDDMYRTLASYSRYDKGHTTQAQLLLAGEFDASLTVYTQSVDREIEKDAEAPIHWRKSDGRWIEPLVFFPQGVTLMKNAPHPAAAMLFEDFLLTEGLVILSQEDRTPTSLSLPGGPLEGIPKDDLHQVDLDMFFDRDTWATRFDELLRGA